MSEYGRFRVTFRASIQQMPIEIDKASFGGERQAPRLVTLNGVFTGIMTTIRPGDGGHGKVVRRLTALSLSVLCHPLLQYHSISLTRKDAIYVHFSAAPCFTSISTACSPTKKNKIGNTLN